MIVEIDFNQPTVSSWCLGNIGEHNATMLKITPPSKLTSDPRTSYYILEFKTGGEVISSSPISKNDSIELYLWNQLTQHTQMVMQLVAYDSDGDYIGKSKKLDKFYFIPSISGTNTPMDDSNKSLVNDIIANTEARHKHDNKSALDRFGADGDTPTFDGNPIGGSQEIPTKTSDLENDGSDGNHPFTSLDEQFLSNLNIKIPYDYEPNDYFYAMDYSNINFDYAWADNWFKSKNDFEFGGCSTVVKGNIIGRNYDMYYNEAPSVLVRTSAVNGRHMSIGTAQYSKLTSEIINARSINHVEKFKILPYIMLDGVNNKGVYCSINVTNILDRGRTTGTNPDKEDMCIIMIPRYILDYANSADHAIELLGEKNLWAPDFNSESVQLSEEYHFIISDEEKCYIVEFVNNEMKVKLAVDVDNRQAAILTNFSVVSADGNRWFNGHYIPREDATETDDFFKASEHPMGVERFDILAELYSDIELPFDMMGALADIRYTKAYDRDIDPFWYSEYSDNYILRGIDLAWGTPLEDYIPIVNQAITWYEEEHATGSRTSKSWQTVHSAVYDVHTRSILLCTQENYSKPYYETLDDYIPRDTSDLTNGEGYQTEDDVHYIHNWYRSMAEIAVNAAHSKYTPDQMAAINDEILTYMGMPIIFNSLTDGKFYFTVVERSNAGTINLVTRFVNESRFITLSDQNYILDKINNKKINSNNFDLMAEDIHYTAGARPSENNDLVDKQYVDQEIERALGSVESILDDLIGGETE